MTTNALTVITPEEQAYLDSLNTGAPTNESLGPTKLSINLKSKDADGVKRPIGSWHLDGTDKYLDGSLTFRPVRYANKLIRYTANANGGYDFAGHTVYFTDFRDEILDSTGGLALGRKFGKAYSEDEKAATKDLADTYADVFGFATFDGEQYPCVLRVRGGKLKAILDAFNAVPKDKRYSQYNYILETEQPMVKNKSTGAMEQKDYWTIKVTPDMSEILPITPILAFDSAVMEYIREINHQVVEAHKKNRAKLEDKELTKQHVAIAKAGSNAKVILPDDDEIPF